MGSTGGSSEPARGAGRREQARSFVDALWGSGEAEALEGLCATIVVTGPDGARCEWWSVTDLSRISERLASLDGEQLGNVYIGATLTGPRDSLPREGGRLRDRPHAVDARAMVGLWIDLDIAELAETPSSKPHVATVADARNLVARLPVRPTLIVHTGHGWQLWWLLAEPWVFGDVLDQEQDRAIAADLSRDWCHTVAAHAEDAGGWAIDSTYDLARLMRPAGTTNRKGALLPVQIIDDSGPRYGVDDLYAALADQEILSAYRLPTVGPESLGGVDLMRVWARITSVSSRERRFTPPWITTMIDNVPDGTLADVWDSGHEGDDPSSVDARLVRLLFDAGCSTEQVCEAVMALHLRTGHKVDKIDPRRRVDYLIRTVGRFKATSDQAREQRESAGRAVDHAATRRVDDRSSRVEAAPVSPESTPRDDAGISPGAAARSIAGEAPPNITGEGSAQRADVAPQLDGNPVGETDDDDHESVDTGATDRFNDDGTVQVTPDVSSGAARGNPPSQSDDELIGEVDARVRPDIERPGPHPDAVFSDDPAPADDDRDPEQVRLMTALTQLLFRDSYVNGNVRVHRIETRNEGMKQEGRLLLSFPINFAWPAGAPKLYRPGRLMPTSWFPRDLFNNHKGFHKALITDLRIAPRRVAPKGKQPKADEATAEMWWLLAEALISYWSNDSSGTDLATAVHDWLRQFLAERPAVRDINDAAMSGRPWLADHSSYRADPPPRIYVSRPVLLAFLCAQPGGPAPGPAVASLLDLLHLTDRRVRGVGPTAKRQRWLEINADQFSHEEWVDIVDDTAEAMLQRERNDQARRHLRSVSDDERGHRAADVLRARLVGDDASSEATAVATGTGVPPGPRSSIPGYQGEEI